MPPEISQDGESSQGDCVLRVHDRRVNPVAVATARGNRHAIVANSGSDDLSVLAIGRDGQPPGFKKLVVVDGTGPPDLIALVAEFQGGLLRSIVYRAQ